jgi:hypothetical protein
VPNDQGGRVYINFQRSFYDIDSLNQSNEGYTIERLDDFSDGSQLWVVVQSGYAYGSEEYTYEVTTVRDSSLAEDYLSYFRVIASMEEGTWISEQNSGFSIDNIAPSQPTSLLGIYHESTNTIELSWDLSDANDLSHYNIYKNTVFHDTIFEAVYIDDMIEDTEYRVSAVDTHDNESDMSDSFLASISLSILDNLIPDEYTLKRAYPNPFNPITTITYGLPEYANVKIVVYDLTGRKVQSLINDFQAAGYYSINWNASLYSSGVYLIRMDSENSAAGSAHSFTQIQKVMLLK